MSVELEMPSNHLILCCPLLLLPSIFPSIRVFSNESVLHIRWSEYWSFSFRISPSNKYSGLISFTMDKLDQSCPTLCDPIDSSPPGSSVHGILQARTLEWVAISFFNDQPRQHIQKQRNYFSNKCPSSQICGFSSSDVWMWELDHKESWAQKNWCFWTLLLEKTLESPLDYKVEKAMAPPLQYSCLENPMDRGAWWAAVHGVTKSRT